MRAEFNRGAALWDIADAQRARGVPGRNNSIELSGRTRDPPLGSPGRPPVSEYDAPTHHTVQQLDAGRSRRTSTEGCPPLRPPRPQALVGKRVQSIRRLVCHEAAARNVRDLVCPAGVSWRAARSSVASRAWDAGGRRWRRPSVQDGESGPRSRSRQALHRPGRVCRSACPWGRVFRRRGDRAMRCSWSLPAKHLDPLWSVIRQCGTPACPGAAARAAHGHRAGAAR
jgi:hypothetical protein